MSTKIYGRTVGTTLPKPSWVQADPKKGDYIKDKPSELEPVRGYSAYQVAVMNGFEGTETEWLETLKGEPGYTPVKGVDYYDGYTPVKGTDYFDGEPGYTPVKGTDYYTEDEKAELVEDVKNDLPNYVQKVNNLSPDENGEITLDLSGLAVDTTLTQSGMAADAYTAGSRFSGQAAQILNNSNNITDLAERVAALEAGGVSLTSAEGVGF